MAAAATRGPAHPSWRAAVARLTRQRTASRRWAATDAVDEAVVWPAMRGCGWEKRSGMGERAEGQPSSISCASARPMGPDLHSARPAGTRPTELRAPWGRAWGCAAAHASTRQPLRPALHPPHRIRIPNSSMPGLGDKIKALGQDPRAAQGAEWYKKAETGIWRALDPLGKSAWPSLAASAACTLTDRRCPSQASTSSPIAPAQRASGPPSWPRARSRRPRASSAPSATARRPTTTATSRAASRTPRARARRTSATRRSSRRSRPRRCRARAASSS